MLILKKSMNRIVNKDGKKNQDFFKNWLPWLIQWANQHTKLSCGPDLDLRSLGSYPQKAVLAWQSPP
jgi:hypothetical protein